MMQRHTLGRLGLTTALVVSSALSAQEPGTIVGVIRDTTGRPIENAQVTLGTNRRTLTTAAGGFRFDRLSDDKYTVSARRIGYYAQSRVVTLGDSGAVADFILVPVARVLPAVISSVMRGGLGGVVEDSTRAPIPQTRVEVFGTGKQTITDSTGAFFVDIKPGRYVLNVSRDGFASRLVGVTVPRDSGRHVRVGLLAASRGASVRQAVAVFELRSRLMRAPGPQSMRLFTREDLDKLGNKEMSDLASFAATRPVDRSCPVTVNGEEQRGLPLWVLETADVELLEIYGGSIAAKAMSSKTKSGGAKPMSTAGSGGCPTIIAWLRR